MPSEHRLGFDLTRRETWNDLPSSLHIIWCFPACPLNLVREFMASRPHLPIRMIVLGSTSAYPSEGTVVTENRIPNVQLPRVQGEEYLRTTAGAVVIRLAGLYGPGRNVLDWIRKGKIRNTARLVNLLHVEDAVGICLNTLTTAPEGSIYLASDGTPRPWSEICTYAEKKWQIAIPPFTSTTDPGKHIDNRKILTELGYTFRFPNLYQALDQLESQKLDER
ncbi:MAG: hypothetical protein R3B74_04300 [Nitrospirales bacterium]|nr:hypothetical protein [Nitrospirales bacterium]